jgi:hypothetical protein
LNYSTPRNLSLGSSLYTEGRLKKKITQTIAQLDVMSMVWTYQKWMASGDKQVDMMRMSVAGTFFARNGNVNVSDNGLIALS